MFNCESCVKIDVCEKRKTSHTMLKDLELNKIIQALKGSGFKFDLECISYLPKQAPRLLGGNYEQ